MALTILTPTEVTRKALAILHNKLKFIKTINREYDSRFATSGAKNGGSLLIRESNQFTVRTGAVMDAQDLSETSQTLTMATQKGVDVNFSSLELTLSLDDFSQRILEPAMSRLAGDVEYTVLSNIYKDIYNITGIPTAEPDAMLNILDANARVSEGLAPEGDRHIIMNSATMAPLVNSIGTYFHKASELERAFADGYIGQAAGLKWWESNMVPSHTNGNRDDTTPVCNTSTGITSGTATVAITALDASSTVKKGDVFTIAGVWDVNQETKQRYAHLKQFVITADGTASGGVLTVSVSPTPVTSGAKQNIDIASAGSGKACVFEAAGGSGTASAVYTQPICYHKDAFTFVTADLEMPKGVDFAARQVYDGISLRIVRQFDIVNDKFPCRIDVLYGYKTLYPQWAVRVRG